VITKLFGLVIDARAATRTHDLLARARAARWIAANALAIGGRPLPQDNANVSSSQARIREEHIADFGDLLAAIAATPSLVDPAALPAHWRLGLSALGVPVLDRPVDDVLAAGASVIRLAA
jgi:hypothetical protein